MNLSGNPLDYLWAFLGGVLMSFGPCVYPLIPVSVSFIGIQAGTGRFRGLALSFTYVSGIALTYSALGLFASLTGSLFGRIAAHPATSIFSGAVIALFGLSMFDIFPFFPGGNLKFPVFKNKGIAAVLVLGLVSGLVVGPCTTPALGAILVYLAAKKNILYGATLLLAFAYGMGLSLILAGTFSGFLARMPKSGRWLNFSKRLAALILFAAGIYFIFTGIRRI